jgi:hypothetical protein
MKHTTHNENTLHTMKTHYTQWKHTTHNEICYLSLPLPLWRCKTSYNISDNEAVLSEFQRPKKSHESDNSVFFFDFQ